MRPVQTCVIKINETRHKIIASQGNIQRELKTVFSTYLQIDGFPHQCALASLFGAQDNRSYTMTIMILKDWRNVLCISEKHNLSLWDEVGHEI